MRLLLLYHKVKAQVLSCLILSPCLLLAESSCSVSFAVINNFGEPLGFQLTRLHEVARSAGTPIDLNSLDGHTRLPLQCGYYEYRLSSAAGNAKEFALNGTVEVDSNYVSVTRAVNDLVITDRNGRQYSASRGLGTDITLSGRVTRGGGRSSNLRVQFLSQSGTVELELKTDGGGDFATKRALNGRFTILVYDNFTLVASQVIRIESGKRLQLVLDAITGHP